MIIMKHRFPQMGLAITNMPSYSDRGFAARMFTIGKVRDMASAQECHARQLFWPSSSLLIQSLLAIKRPQRVFHRVRHQSASMVVNRRGRNYPNNSWRLRGCSPCCAGPIPPIPRAIFLVDKIVDVSNFGHVG
jgi:hypothetical protein